MRIKDLNREFYVDDKVKIVIPSVNNYLEDRKSLTKRYSEKQLNELMNGIYLIRNKSPSVEKNGYYYNLKRCGDGKSLPMALYNEELELIESR